MKPEIAKMWTDALRSGKYKQGRHSLRRYKWGEASYCCLGVLCELYCNNVADRPSNILSDPEMRRKLSDELIDSEAVWVDGDYQGVTEYPPVCVLEWAGLESFNPKIIKMLDQQTAQEWNIPSWRIEAKLSDVNDTLMLNFNRIADLIDELHEWM